MKLKRDPRASAEDVFLVGDELPGDDAERVVSAEPDDPFEGAAVDDFAEAERVDTQPELREGTARRGSPARWLGAVGLGVGIVALVAIVVSGGGDKPREPAATASQSTSAELHEQRSREARAERLRGPREEREQRARERREERRKGQDARDDAAQGDAPVPEPAPAPASPAPAPASATPAPEPAPAPVTTAPAPSAPTPSPEPPADSGGSGSGGGSSCGPYDIGC